MTWPADLHLSPDDIDALLANDARDHAHAHLTACAGCAARYAAEREVVERLALLPLVSPAPDFAERVMARVALPDPFALHALGGSRRRLFASRRGLAAAASVVLVLGAAMAASIVWSLGNRETLAAAGTWLGNEAVSWLWLAVRGAASNLMEQPWYDRARGLLGAPARVAAISAAASLAYLGGVLVLRRLMALPRTGVAHAHA
jgi:hypothetical protein